MGVLSCRCGGFFRRAKDMGDGDGRLAGAFGQAVWSLCRYAVPIHVGGLAKLLGRVGLGYLAECFGAYSPVLAFPRGLIGRCSASHGQAWGPSNTQTRETFSGWQSWAVPVAL